MKTVVLHPKKKPSLEDLRAAGGEFLSQDKLASDLDAWLRQSVHPSIVSDLLEGTEGNRACVVRGNLEVQGDFNPSSYGLTALRVCGDLIVDGVYSDSHDPPSVVLIAGNLRARNVVTGAHLEVHGDLHVRHLAGEYNDQGATVVGKVTATTFFPENHSFDFRRQPTFALMIGENAIYRVSEAVRGALRVVSNGCLPAYLKKPLLRFSDVQADKIHSALRKGQEILAVDDPSEITPEQAIFPRTIWKKLDRPSTIRTLSLAERGLKELPPAVLTFTGLTSLDLYHNQITELPAGIGDLTKLEELNLEFNSLRQVPKELGRLRNLRKLSIRYNRSGKNREAGVAPFDVLPDELGELTKLEELDVSSNALLALPDSLKALKKLRVLNISNNSFTSVPEVLVHLPSLSVLSLGDQRQAREPGGDFSRALEPVWALSQLRALEIDRLGLSAIPEGIGRLGQLESLNLGHNPLRVLPDAVAQLKALKRLELHGTFLVKQDVEKLVREALLSCKIVGV